MKTVFFLLLSISLNAFEYNLKPMEVTKNIYCFFGKPEMITKANGGNMVNSCYIKTKEGYIVVDSGPTYQYAKQAYAAMKSVAALPVKYVITTHEHDDHWLGNSFYKDQGALLIGPRTYEQNIASESGMIDPRETRMAKTISKEAFAQTRIVSLDKVLDMKPYHFSLGDKEVEIRQVVPVGHSKADLIVYLPQEKAVFTGDLVFNDRLTSMRDGSIIGNLQAIDIIDALEPKWVITGHGLLTDKHATKHQKAYLSEMKEKVLDAIDNGIGMEKITEVVPMKSFSNDALYEVLHNRNVLDAYTELEMYDEDE